jgi:beta-galactosidase
MHTFFDSSGWGHGVAIVNGFNIGRYWPLLGPQVPLTHLIWLSGILKMSLFVPGAVMKNENVVVLLELVGRQKADSNIQFTAEPILKYTEDLFPTANPIGEIQSEVSPGYLR